MKKIQFILLFTAILFLFAACNKKPDIAIVEEREVDIEEVIEDDSETNETDEEASDSERNDDESTKDNETTESPMNSTNKNDNVALEKNNDLWEKPNQIENMEHLDIVHLAYDIFAAQDRKDYEFLESVAAKGTTVDHNNDKFSFENVTYPFEMNFFTKEDLGELEFRYTHEQDDGVVIVGFGAINYEEESSFVIDFEFIQESNKWKMKSMDINK